MIDQRADEFGPGRPFFDGLGEVLIHLLSKRETSERKNSEQTSHVRTILSKLPVAKRVLRPSPFPGACAIRSSSVGRCDLAGSIIEFQPEGRQPFLQFSGSRVLRRARFSSASTVGRPTPTLRASSRLAQLQ